MVRLIFPRPLAPPARRAALFALAISAASAAPLARHAPALRIARLAPLTVEGRGFGPREEVHLTVITGELELSRDIAASAAGAFDVRFGVRVDPCRASVIVTASRRGGGRSVRALSAQRRCPPRPDAELPGAPRKDR
jgi:hypothetical protein